MGLCSFNHSFSFFLQTLLSFVVVGEDIGEEEDEEEERMC